MLILTRKPGESFYIDDDVKVIIKEIKGNQVRVGVEAPASRRIFREEIYLQILEENRAAAKTPEVSDAGLEGLSDLWKGRQLRSGSATGENKPTSFSGLGSFSTQRAGQAKPKESVDVVIKRKRPKRPGEVDGE